MICAYTGRDVCWLKIMHGQASECKDNCAYDDDDPGAEKKAA